MWIGAAIAGVAIILDVATFGSKEQYAEQLSPTASQNEITGSYVGSLVGMVIGGLIQASLWLWMAWKTGQGRRWARILSTVFAAINVAWTPIMLARSAVADDMLSTALTPPIGLAGLAVGVIAVVLLWLTRSSRFFNADRSAAGPGYGS